MCSSSCQSACLGHRCQQITVFVVTFLSYASFHACRQAFANAKESMENEWGYTRYQQGTMDACFLSAYAIGLFVSGRIGDLFDAKKVHLIGLIGTAVIVVVFAAFLHSWPLAAFLWILNGIVQSTGWPTSIKLLWLSLGSSSSHGGVLFGIWASNQCIGNIIGSAYVNFAHVYDWTLQWMFYLPAIQSLIISIAVYLLIPSATKSIDDLNDIDQLQSAVEMSSIPRIPGPNSKYIEQNDSENIINSQKVDHGHDPDALVSDAKLQNISFLDVFKLQNVMTYCLCFACLKSVNYAMFFWLPFFETNGGFSAADADYLEMSYNVGQIVGALLCGLISDRFSKRSPTVIAFLITAPIPIFMLHLSSSSFTEVFVLTLAAGFLVGGPANILSTVMTGEIAKDPTLDGNSSVMLILMVLSSVTGIVDGSGSIGAAIVCFTLSADFSMKVVFGILAGLLFVSAMLLIPLCLRDCRDMRQTRQHERMRIDSTDADDRSLIPDEKN